jgi:hypothetical protein
MFKWIQNNKQEVSKDILVLSGRFNPKKSPVSTQRAASFVSRSYTKNMNVKTSAYFFSFITVFTKASLNTILLTKNTVNILQNIPINFTFNLWSGMTVFSTRIMLRFYKQLSFHPYMLRASTETSFRDILGNINSVKIYFLSRKVISK